MKRRHLSFESISHNKDHVLKKKSKQIAAMLFELSLNKRYDDLTTHVCKMLLLY